MLACWAKEEGPKLNVEFTACSYFELYVKRWIKFSHLDQLYNMNVAQILNIIVSLTDIANMLANMLANVSEHVSDG